MATLVDITASRVIIGGFDTNEVGFPAKANGSAGPNTTFTMPVLDGTSAGYTMDFKNGGWRYDVGSQSQDSTDGHYNGTWGGNAGQTYRE